jgi:hypothetical protein
MTDVNASRPNDQGREGLKQTAEEAKRAAQSSAEAAKSRAREAAEGARDRVTREASDRQHRLGEETHRVADALRESGDRFDADAPQARVFHAAAGVVDDVASAFRDREPGDLLGAVSDFGRRNPGLFLGLSAFAGFALARAATARVEPDYDDWDDEHLDEDGDLYEDDALRAAPPLSPAATPAPPPAAPPAGGLSPSPAPGAAPGLAPTPAASPTPAPGAASDPLNPTARPAGATGPGDREI